MKQNSLFLSELVDIKDFSSTKINVVFAPVGSGKTYFALKYLPSKLVNPHYEMIMLIDTVNGREQCHTKYDSCDVPAFWPERVCGKFTTFQEENSKGILTITYAKFGALVKDYPDLPYHLKYIVCDELHQGIKYQHYQKITAEERNYHKAAIEIIGKVAANPGTCVIALSATPKKIYEQYGDLCYTVPIDEKCLRHYETETVSSFSNIYSLLKSIDSKLTGLCYTPRITTMKQLIDYSNSIGIPASGFWSIHNEDHCMTSEQYEVRNAVLRESVIPKDYNLLFINSSSETSIKIDSPVDYVIVNTRNPDIQTQVRGRINHNLATQFNLNMAGDYVAVPVNYIETELWGVQKEALCKELNLRNGCGRRYGWTTVKSKIMDNGYGVNDYRRNDKRYSIISAAEDM